jgi:hypothetical protein
LRIFSNNKGQARLIEAFLATLLLIGCVALIPTYSAKTHPPDFASIALEKLTTLDNNGQLAALIDAGNWVALKSCIDSVIPLTLWYNLTIFDQHMNALNSFPLCSSGTVSENINSVDYVSVSPGGTYRVYILRLQLSQVGSQS